MDAVERAYAREVYARNEAILGGVSHDLVHVFYNAMQQFQDKVCVCVRACVLVCDCLLCEMLIPIVEHLGLLAPGQDHVGCTLPAREGIRTKVSHLPSPVQQ